MGQTQSLDTAIAFVFFNPARSKRMLMNYLYTINRLNGLPCYTLELVFEDREPEIPESPNVFHVKSNSYMFHKERMCRVLETKIPKKFKKIVFMDADLFYLSNKWYHDMSEKLDQFDVVQGFEICHWLDLSYKKIMLSRPSALLTKSRLYSHEYHPGFIWGFRRDWYKKVGFFDWCVSGSGDTLSVAGWTKQEFDKSFSSLPLSMVKSYIEFKKQPKPRISYLKDIHVFHLYHGSRTNRRYVDRHKPVNIAREISNIVKVNDDGMFEWKEPNRWNQFFIDYFNSREDDGIELYEEVISTELRS